MEHRAHRSPNSPTALHQSGSVPNCQAYAEVPKRARPQNMHVELARGSLLLGSWASVGQAGLMGAIRGVGGCSGKYRTPRPLRASEHGGAL